MSFDSRESFLAFYEAHVVKVRGLLFRLAGESALGDLVQEVFMKAWENRKKFRGESEASTWLYRIAYNSAIDYLRRNKKRTYELPEDIYDETSLETEQVGKDLVEKILQSLDLEQRTLVVLFYLEERSVLEISKILEIPEGTVKSRLSQARTKISQYLEKKGVLL